MSFNAFYSRLRVVANRALLASAAATPLMAQAPSPTPPKAPAAAAPAQPSPKPEPAKAAPPPSAPPASAGAPTFPAAIAPKYATQTPGRARLHTCLDQYHANKTAHADGGLKWIQKGGGYYSQCLKKLKTRA